MLFITTSSVVVVAAVVIRCHVLALAARRDGRCDGGDLLGAGAVVADPVNHDRLATFENGDEHDERMVARLADGGLRLEAVQTTEPTFLHEDQPHHHWLVAGIVGFLGQLVVVEPPEVRRDFDPCTGDQQERSL